jgi:arylsulfatase A-like enzyme
MARPRGREFVASGISFLLGVAWLQGPTPARAGVATPPNVILILVDDMRWDYLRYMPNVERELVAPGVMFANAFVENPMCCPSRVSFLTGNDSHTTGIFTNAPPDGGYQTFHDSGGESSTLATWLHDAGYHTGLIGKYLNGYGPNNLVIPPGWDRWVAFDRANGAYYDYDLNVDGTIVHYGMHPAGYSTDVLAADAESFIQTAPGGQPLFLYLAPYGPHSPTKPAPRDVRTVSEGPAFRPNVNEIDVRDKPRYVRNRSAVDPARLDGLERRTIETLASEDDAVGGIVEALDEADRLSNTVLVFASDNGYLLGEHRIVGKQAPYEESIRVPLVIRDDALGAPAGARTQLVMNTDVAPTLAALAGVSPPPTDGGTLVPILQDPSAPGRRRFLFEHARQQVTTGDLFDLPSYCAMRTRRWVFVHYGSGFEELYELSKDPYEMRNLALRGERTRVLRNLRTRTRAACTPLPPGVPPF